MSEQQSVEDKKFYGKYRGRVIDNMDPFGLGRIRPEMSSMPHVQLNWAMPCVPYAGPQVGLYVIPPIGANIWIEYEGGDLNFPIWTGCFWGEGDLPTWALPYKKVFKTESITMILNDEPGVTDLSIECKLNEREAITVRLNSEGIRLESLETKIVMTSETIKLTVPDSEISLAPEGITLTTSEISMAIAQSCIDAVFPSSGFLVNEKGITQYDK